MAVAVGAKVSGKVTGITNFGAFVDMGDGQTGLVHISEISDQFIKDIHDVLSVGDEVTVKVMSMQAGKIGLSIRKATDAPAGQHAPQQREHREAGPRRAPARPSEGGDRRPARPARRDFGGKRNSKDAPEDGSFDSLLSGFLKDSEQRLSTIRRNTEGKRGGRGGRRS